MLNPLRGGAGEEGVAFAMAMMVAAAAIAQKEREGERPPRLLIRLRGGRLQEDRDAAGQKLRVRSMKKSTRNPSEIAHSLFTCDCLQGSVFSNVNSLWG